MSYFLNVFSPGTWHIFHEHGSTVTAFPERLRNLAEQRVRPGDIFICYMTTVSRWCGALRVESDVYCDDSPIFEDPDPYTTRFKVSPIVLLSPESAIPVREERVWSSLSLAKRYQKSDLSWVGFVRNPLTQIDDDDGIFLVRVLTGQMADPEDYPLTDSQKRRISRIESIPTSEGTVQVEIPDNEGEDAAPLPRESILPRDERESIQMQAKVATIGAAMGFDVWVPSGDKSRVLRHVPPMFHQGFLSRLPLPYNPATLKTVEQIDVIWIEKDSIVRAFEIEHTTPIYSGLLRMADLLTLQPNIDIRLHIVASKEKEDSVLSQIGRPVFTQLRRGPLASHCSFLSYDAVDSLAESEFLPHMNESVIQDYEVHADI